MKKKILFVILLITIPFLFLKDPRTEKRRWYTERDWFPELVKDKKWDFVKYRLFDSSGDEVKKFIGPILFRLVNASVKDSTAVKNVFAELKSLLPNKEIGFFKDYTGVSFKHAYDDRTKIIKGYKITDLERHVITLDFKESSDDFYNLRNDDFFSTLNEQTEDYFPHYDRRKVSGYVKPSFNFKFSKKQSTKEIQDVLRLYIVRTITCANLFSDKTKQNSKVGSMLNSSKVTSWHTGFTEYDQFLLQKLYDPNLLPEFKEYMYKTYPWRYAIGYINKEIAKVIAVWSSIGLGVLLLMLGFTVLYQQKYQHNYLSYFVPLFVILFSIENLMNLYYYLSDYRVLFKVFSYLKSTGYTFLYVSISSFLLMMFDKYGINNKMTLLLKAVLIVGFTFLILSMQYVLPSIFLNNYASGMYMYKLSPVLLCVFFIGVGRGALLYFESFSESLVKQKDVELNKLKALNAKAEVSLLQFQINPHFLYNALNSIASLASVDGVKTEKMALSLSDLFKYTINRQGKKDTTIYDEIEMVKNYLEVEQFRFGDRLTYSIDVDVSLENIHIPMFIIQPLVENAIKHGVSKIEGKGKINVHIYKEDKNLLINIKDNGPEFSDGLLSGHGLQTVSDLLFYTYKNQASLEWTNVPEKMITIMIINIA